MAPGTPRRRVANGGAAPPITAGVLKGLKKGAGAGGAGGNGNGEGGNNNPGVSLPSQYEVRSVVANIFF